LTELGYHLESFLGNANASGVGIVNKNLRLAGIGMKRSGNTANVIAVAKGKQGKYANGSVFTSM
jgi:hypothetical protein